MSIQVRPLQAQDLAPWSALWQSYLTFYNSTLPPEQTERTWQRLMDAQFNLHGLAALQGDTLVGITHYLFHPSSWTEHDDCYLQDLFVVPEHRGQGIARQLIDSVVDAAKGHPAQRVYWLTQESNATARLLYDKVASSTGFIQYRIAPL